MPPKDNNPNKGGGNGNGGPKKDNQAPSLIGPIDLSTSENVLIVTDFDTDDDTATWSVVGGADGDLFAIDPDTGVLSFRSAPDYEAPLDTGGDNIYNLTVAVADTAGNTTTRDITVTVENVLEDSDLPSYVGETAFAIDENSTAIGTLQANRDVSWSIGGGDDADLFTITAETGALAFVEAPDYESPADYGADNTYDVVVQFEDAYGHVVLETLQVTVADVVEDTPPTPYSNLVIFGDSLSDNGSFRALAAEFLAPGYSVPFQYDGDGSVRTYGLDAFTDGTAYADTLAGLLSLESGYDNFAFGGAQALGSKFGADYINKYSNLSYTTISDTTRTFSIVADTEAALAAYGGFDINLAAQVDRYIAATPGGAAEDTLVIINIGANDLGEFDTSFFNILLGGVNDFAEDLGVEVEIQARRAADHGASGLALYTLPVAEFFIGYDDLNWLEAPVARDLLDSVNDEILYRAQLLNADGIATDVVRLDIMSEELRSDMQSHGFLYHGPYLFGYSGDPTWLETSQGVIEPVFSVNATAAAYREEQILFFDEIHPSGALHDMLAVFSSESLSTEEVFGSASGDVIAMTDADDFVGGRGGSDAITLGGGDDVGLGGLGNDTLLGNDGSDLLIGGAGNDYLQGGAGNDFLAGSSGDDNLSGGDEADILIGGLGNDIVSGEAGDDVLIFFEEKMWGGTGGSTDFYDGGEGADILLVFMLSAIDTVLEKVSGILTFGDGHTLSFENIETIEFHMGLPEDPESPIHSLTLPDDLWARYDEAQLWGVA